MTCSRTATSSTFTLKAAIVSTPLGRVPCKARERRVYSPRVHDAAVIIGDLPEFVRASHLVGFSGQEKATFYRLGSAFKKGVGSRSRTIVHVYADGRAYDVGFVALDGHTTAVATAEADHVRRVS